MRDGLWIEIPCRELVPGDIIRLVAGDMVPADSLLLKASDGINDAPSLYTLILLFLLQV